jgi:hypothetical protein
VTALEGFKHQIPHRADIGLDALQPVGVALAILCALAIHAVALGQQLALKPDQHRVIGEGPAGDGAQKSDEAADQRGDGGGDAAFAQGGRQRRWSLLMRQALPDAENRRFHSSVIRPIVAKLIQISADAATPS